MFRMAARAHPEQQLDFFIDKFTPEIAALARRVLARCASGCRARVDSSTTTTTRWRSDSDRRSGRRDAILSVVVYPRWAQLYFLQGAALPDPAGS